MVLWLESKKIQMLYKSDLDKTYSNSTFFLGILLIELIKLSKIAWNIKFYFSQKGFVFSSICVIEFLFEMCNA